MERPPLEQVSDEVESYIRWLEKQVNGSSRLINELNLTCDVWADDLAAIREGKETIYIGQAAKSKKFEHVMTMIKEIASIKALAQATVNIKPVATEKRVNGITDIIMGNK